jgi:phage FluMu protein Com
VSGQPDERARREQERGFEKTPEPANDNTAGPSQWYLTVRCTVCTRLIAFQKARFPGGNPNLRIAAEGELSVHCPNCKSLVRFRPKQIERQNVVLTT